MKKQKSLADLLFEDDRILKEEEDDEGDDIFGDDSGDDDGGDDDSGDDSGDDEDSGGDDEDSGDDDSEDSDDEDKDEDKDDEKPSGPADDTIDGEVNNLLADFESEAVSSAEEAAALGESSKFNNMHKQPVAKLLFEADESPIDVNHFANNVARVINNYQTLMDVEKMIFDKAKSFLSAKYGEQVAKEFESVMESDHELSFVTGASDSAEDSHESLPIAAGAMTPG